MSEFFQKKELIALRGGGATFTGLALKYGYQDESDPRDVFRWKLLCSNCLIRL